MIKFINLTLADEKYRRFALDITNGWFKKKRLQAKPSLEQYYPSYWLEAMLYKGTPVGLIAFKPQPTMLLFYLTFHVLASEARFKESGEETLVHLENLARLWGCTHLKTDVLEDSFACSFAIDNKFYPIASQNIMGYTYITMRRKL